MTAGQTSSRSGSLHLDKELGRAGLPVEKVGNSLPLQTFIFFSQYQSYVSFHCQTYGQPLMRLTLLLLNMQVVLKQVKLAIVMNT